MQFSIKTNTSGGHSIINIFILGLAVFVILAVFQVFFQANSALAFCGENITNLAPSGDISGELKPTLTWTLPSCSSISKVNAFVGGLGSCNDTSAPWILFCSNSNYNGGNALTVGQYYTWWVCYDSDFGQVCANATFRITSGPSTDPPGAPTDFSGTSAGMDKINWSWTNQADTEYIRWQGGTNIDNVEDYQQTGLSCNTTVDGYVTACNSAASPTCSGESNHFSVTTDGSYQSSNACTGTCYGDPDYSLTDNDNGNQGGTYSGDGTGACCLNANYCIDNGFCYGHGTYKNLTSNVYGFCYGGQWLDCDGSDAAWGGGAGSSVYCGPNIPANIKAGSAGVGEYDNTNVVEYCGDDLNENVVTTDCQGNSVSVCCPDSALNYDSNSGACVANCPLPDLIVSNTSAPANVTAGVSFSIDATIDNTGTAGTGQSFWNTLYFDGGASGTGSDWMAALSAGNNDTATFLNVVLTPGTHTYYVCADNRPGPITQITELDENNNCSSTGTINANLPDLIPDSASAPAVMCAGQLASLDGTIKNQGQANVLGSYKNELTLGSWSCNSGQTDDLPDIGQTEPYSCFVTPTAAGSYTLTFEVDSGVPDDIAESDEGNNGPTSFGNWTVSDVLGAPGGLQDIAHTASSITWTWNSVSGATDYEYRVDGGGWSSSSGATSVTPGGLSSCKTHTIDVRTKNQCGSGNSTSDSGDTLGCNQCPVVNPSPITPLDGATGVPVTTDFDWSASDPDGNPLTYEVYLNGSHQSSCPSSFSSCSNTNMGGPFAEYTSYNWEVYADDGQCTPLPSGGLWSFTTADTTNPNCSNPSYSPSGLTNGCVDVTVDCSDPSPGSGCAQTTYTTTMCSNGTPSFTISDNYGNSIISSCGANVTNIDNTPPTCSGAPTYSPSGPTCGSVTVSQDCSDSESGCTQATFSTAVSANGAGFLTIQDNAGNTTLCPYDVTNIDCSAPTASFAGVSNNCEEVTWTFSGAADSGSGLDPLPYSFDDGGNWTSNSSLTENVTVTGQSSNVSRTGRVRDKVGNYWSGSDTVTVYVCDNIDPICGSVTYSPSGPTCGNVDVTVQCSDSQSGCQQPSYSTTVSANGAGSITIWDNNNNSTSCSYNVTNIDCAAPSVSAANAACDAYNDGCSLDDDTTIYFTWDHSDTGGSGIAECRAELNDSTPDEPAGTDKQDTDTGQEGSNKYYVQCSDNAGNQSNIDFDTITIDTQNPSVSVAGAPGSWTNTTVNADVDCFDDGSGCDSDTYALRKYNSAGVCSTNYSKYNRTPPQSVTDHTWYCAASKDYSGRSGFSPTRVEFKVDQINPTADSFTVNNGNPTNTTGNVPVSWTSSDTGGSGVDRVEVWRAPDSGGSPGSWGQIYTGPEDGSMSPSDSPGDGTWWYGIHVIDNAGNCVLENNANCSGTGSPIQVTVDSGDPTVTLASTPNAFSGWINTNADIFITCFDAGTGCNASRDNLWFYSSNPGSCPTSYDPTPANQYSSPVTKSSHLWACGYGEDLIANWDNDGPDEILIDQIAPTIGGFTINGAAFGSTNLDTDGTVDIAWSGNLDTGNSGLKEVQIWFTDDAGGVPNSSNWQLTESSITSNLVSGATTHAPGDGKWWYGIHIIDNAGNCIQGNTTVSNGHCGGVSSDSLDGSRVQRDPILVTVDANPPVLSTNPADSGGWKNTLATVAIKARDAGSGINQAKYEWSTLASAPGTFPGTSGTVFNSACVPVDPDAVCDTISQPVCNDTYYLYMWAQDSGGLQTPVTQFGTYQCDNIYPEIPQLTDFTINGQDYTSPVIITTGDPDIAWSTTDPVGPEGSGVGSVTLWRAPYENDGGADCDEFDKSNCTWSQIPDAATAYGASGSYTDAGLINGKYWYGLQVTDNAIPSGNCLTESATSCGGTITVGNPVPGRAIRGPILVDLDRTVASFTWCSIDTNNVSFTDASQPGGGTNLISWQWDFGDSACPAAPECSLQNPIHNFTGSSGNISSRVASSNDDAEERLSNNSMYRTSSDLELIRDVSASEDQEVGMRFNNITIPQSAAVTNAYIEFTVDETTSGATNLTFWGEDIDNAPAFSAADFNITSRSKTSASVNWNNVPDWTTIGATHQTPDLSPVIQEIINRPGWSSGNSLVLIATGSGRRTAESYDGSPSQAPLLVVDYTGGCPGGVCNVSLTVTDDNTPVAGQDTDVQAVTPGANLCAAPLCPRPPIDPIDGEINIPTSKTLTWTGGHGDGATPVQYHVYLGTNQALVESGDISTYQGTTNWDVTQYAVGPLNTNTTYYWKIIGDDASLQTDSAAAGCSGSAWSFTTSGGAGSPPTASFEYCRPDPVGLPDTVKFFDTSTDDGAIVSWDWEFGDSSANSSLQHPTHTFSSGPIQVFSDDFNDGDYNGWTIVDLAGQPYNWSVTSGHLQEWSNKGNTIILSPYNSSATDYTITASARALGNGNDNVDIVFGYQDQSNYYMFLWDDPSGWYGNPNRQIVQISGGSPNILAQDTGIAMTSNQWYSLNVNVSGGTIVASVDGSPVLTASAAPQLQQNGMWSNDNDGRVQYDDYVIVEGSGGGGGPYNVALTVTDNDSNTDTFTVNNLDPASAQSCDFYLTASANSCTYASLQWDDPPSLPTRPVIGADSFDIYRNSGFLASIDAQNATYCGASGCAWDDNSVSESTSYNYTVNAIRFDASVLSNVNGAQTANVPACPVNPANLSVTSPLCAQMLITWDSSAGADGYNVYRSLSSTGPYNKYPAVEPIASSFPAVYCPVGCAALTPATATTYTDTEILADVTYYYYITTLTDTGSTESEISNVESNSSFCFRSPTFFER